METAIKFESSKLQKQIPRVGRNIPWGSEQLKKLIGQLNREM